MAAAELKLAVVVRLLEVADGGVQVGERRVVAADRAPSPRYLATRIGAKGAADGHPARVSLGSIRHSTSAQELQAAAAQAADRS